MTVSQDFLLLAAVVLGFDVTIVDGPGADLIVSENPFLVSGVSQSYAEMIFVEVHMRSAS